MESFSCSPFSLESEDVKLFPDKLPEILCFIYYLNNITSIAQAQYCLNFNTPFPFPEVKENGKTILPLSSYCCYISTLVSKHFLKKFYPELTDIKVVNGLYKGVGEHSWLELKWQNKNYIFDTKPYYQGYPNMYNFGTPESKYKKLFFIKFPIMWGRTKEYKMRLELSRWCIHILTRMGLKPLNSVNQRRMKMWNKYSLARMNELKVEYNRTRKPEDRLELDASKVKYSADFKSN